MIDRLRRLREAAAVIGADAAIVTHPANRHYFSGFPAGDHAPDESSGILVVSEERRSSLPARRICRGPRARSAHR